MSSNQPGSGAGSRPAMRIVDLTLTIFDWTAGSHSRLPGAGEAPRSGDLGYLRVVTDAGLVGESFLGALDYPASLDAPRLLRWLKPVLLGRDPLQREALHHELNQLARFAGLRSVGSVDVALWDLAGKAAGLPIHQLLGTARSRVPVYVSSQRFAEAAGYVEQAQEIKEGGWAGYKLHPPKRPELDIEILRKVRSACGGDYPLMLDGGWHYYYPTALRIGRALEAEGYLWFEDPLGPYDLYQYVKLRNKLDIPLLATELPSAGLDSYASWLTERATDMLRGDVPTKGGITAMVKTAHLAEAFGMNYEIHYSGNALCDLANVHVAMAIRHCSFLESLVPDPLHHYGARGGLAIDSNGQVAAPSAAGLGVEVDHELIASRTVQVLS